jgi:hypothetical protein
LLTTTIASTGWARSSNEETVLSIPETHFPCPPTPDNRLNLIGYLSFSANLQSRRAIRQDRVCMIKFGV